MGSGQGVFEGSKVMEGISMCIRIWFSSRFSFLQIKNKNKTLSHRRNII